MTSSPQKLDPELVKALDAQISVVAKLQQEGRYFPLSYSQLLLWFISFFESKSKNELTGYYFWGSLDFKKLEGAFNKILQKNDIFQFSFNRFLPLAKVIKLSYQSIEFHDISTLPSLEQDEFINEKNRAIERMDLRKAHTTHACLIKLEDYKYLMIVGFSHLVTDAISKTLFWHDLITHYLNHQIHREKTNYQDYICIERAYHHTHIDEYNKALKKINRPELIPCINEKFLDKEISLVKKRNYFKIKPELISRMRTLAKQHKVTLENLLTGIFIKVMSQYLENEAIYIFNNNNNLFPELFNTVYGPHLQENIILLNHIKSEDAYTIAQHTRDEVWQQTNRFLPYCYGVGYICDNNLKEMKLVDNLLFSLVNSLQPALMPKKEIPPAFLNAYRGLMKFDHYNNSHVNKLILIIFNFRYDIGVHVPEKSDSTTLYAWQPYLPSHFTSNYYLCVNVDRDVDHGLLFHFESPLLEAVSNQISQECLNIMMKL